MFNRQRTIDALIRWYRGNGDSKDVAVLLAYGLIRQNRYTARTGVVSYEATPVGIRTASNAVNV